MVSKISRRNFLKSSSVATFALALPGLPKIETASQFDLILKNAHIFDGTGNPAWNADILFSNPAKVKSNATFANPHQFASGFKLVLVNGKIVILNGVHTGVKAGKALRRG